MSQTFTTSPVDWSDYFHSAPPSTIISSDPNPTTFTFDSKPPAPPPIGTKSTTPRVTKPARKRARASRRTPTTLLSTDTSNFRAMVQQFTGGPAAAIGGFGISGPIDHPLPRRFTDHQAPTSFSPFAFPSGHNFQFQKQTLNVKNNGGVNNSY